MATDWDNLPPVPADDPMFSGQVSFVFRHELPADEDENEDEAEDSP